jgi:class 3 adenylate cyclase/pimeloyl-ACP methyl ester carboxylesterase
MPFEVRYARRDDGARTAYAVMGKGPVLVLPPGGLTHLEWYTTDTAAHERFCGGLAEHRTVVLYDRHGCGLSDRTRSDFTFDDDLKDLDAVIRAVGAEQMDFFGISWGGSPAIAYAALHSERVRRLVLYGTFSAGRVRADDAFEARMQSLGTLRRADWTLYHRTRALQFFPSGADADTFASLGRMLGNSATPEMAERLEAVVAETQSLLSRISVPTLVLHRRGDQVCPVEWGQYLARRIPEARFVALEGDAHFPWVGDFESVLQPTIEFLTVGVEANRPSFSADGGFRTVLFTDVVASTPLLAQLKDAKMRAIMRDHDTVLHAAVEKYRGRVIKTIGDAFMAEFALPSAAVEAAIEIQRGIHARFADSDVPIRLRVGINAGEPVEDGGDLHGASVVIAKRLESAAPENGILVADGVKQLLAGKDFAFVDQGPIVLKGFDEPVRAWAVEWN